MKGVELLARVQHISGNFHLKKIGGTVGGTNIVGDHWPWGYYLWMDKLPFLKIPK